MRTVKFYPNLAVRFFHAFCLCCSLLIFTAISVYAQQPSADLDQIRNGPADNPTNPADYVNGNVGSQTAHFLEGYSISYRCVMENLPTDGTVISIIFEYDAKHGGKHAIDFITHYDNIDVHDPPFGHEGELIEPRQDFEAVVPAAFVTVNIPTPPGTNTPVPGEPGNTFNALPGDLKLMTLYGGNFSGANPISYVLAESLLLPQAAVQFQVDFVATNSTAILAWGGHIATQATWGDGESAVGISGSPYHMRLIDWNLTNLGNQDRSCSVDAVYIPPPCDFTGPETLCQSSEGTYTVDVDDPDFTYVWSIEQNGTNAFFVGGINTEASVQINSGTQPGSFTVTVSVTDLQNSFPISTECSMVVTVPAPVDCLIEGDEEVCPNSTSTYSGPIGDYTYAWSVVGNGSISGPADGPTVDVLAGSACPGEYTVHLDLLSANECPTSCDLVVAVDDLADPVISGVGADQTIQCPAIPVFSNPTVSDPCDPSPLLTFDDVVTPGECAQEYSVTRTWTATDACGNSSQASQTIYVEDNTAPSITGVGDDLTIECPAVPSFSNPIAEDLCDEDPLLDFDDVVTPGECAQEYSVTRTWTATDACGNSSQASQTIYVEDNTAPDIFGVGPDTTIICPAEPVFSEPWATDLCDPEPELSYVTDSIPGDCPDSYTLVRTWTAVDACGNESSASQTIIHLPNPNPPIEQVNLIGGEALTGDCGEEVTIPFPEIITPCGPAVVEYFRSDGGSWFDPFEVGTTEVCFWGVSPCGYNTDTLCLTVVIDPCGDQFCSLTQGFYGNEGGTFCNGMGTVELIESLLEVGPLVVGSGSNTMTFVAGESGCIIELLPGSGPAKTISGANTCASHPGIQIKNGRIFNILLAQTITLGLNLRLDVELGDLEMLSDTLVTAESSGCDGEGDTVTSGYTKYAIPASVYNVLSQNGSITPTIWDLYALANTGLGGGAIGATTLSAISDAVDAINRGFDECRIGYFQEPLPPLQSQLIGGESQQQQLSDITLNVYPNPFSSSTSIEFVLPESGHVSVEVYNLMGQRVADLYDGHADGGESYKYEFRGDPSMNQVTYIAVIKTGKQVHYQRIMMMR